MEAKDYNKAQIDAGKLTIEHITELVRFFQQAKHLDDDGKAGPVTRSVIEQQMDTGPVIWCWPMRCLPDGRQPQVTSGFRNPQRKNHSGVDIMYRYLKTDPPMKVGDGGRTQNWWVPEGTEAVAIGKGRVAKVEKLKTGWRVEVLLDDQYRAVYYHLSKPLVAVYNHVERGQAVGIISDNPADFDPDHLHFELLDGPKDRVDPMTLLKTAEMLEAKESV